MSLLAKFNLILILVFSISLIPAGYVSYNLLQNNARTQVTQNARLMMQTAMAVRGYTIKQIKPLLEPALATTFLPQTVPAYSAMEIFNYLRESNPEYTYKEATLNPTNPRDRTVEWEADVVAAFRSDPKKKEMFGERSSPQGRSLFLAHPIQITDAKCLACHNTPDAAPPTIIKAYGPGNGFGWKMNEVIGAQIVTVPMSIPIGMADKAFQTLLVSLVGVFALTLVFMNILLHFVVIRPMKRLSQMADQVSMGNMDVPEVKPRGRDEVAVLAGSFNRMRISLIKALKMLEDV
jgi:HAMP domain-containing protein